MGLPQLLIQFKTTGSTAVKRSQRGIVALILKDDTNSQDSFSVASINDVNESEWTAGNYDAIQLAFKANPSEVIIERIASSATDYTDALTRLETKKFNYLAIPSLEDSKVDAVKTWVENMRTADKTLKAVLPNCAGDHEGIINFTAANIKVGSTTYATAGFTPRIAGVLAAMPLNQSATYHVLGEVDDVDAVTGPDAAIDGGQLILINDGEKVKIGRAVNSLTTLKVGMNDQFKKIKILDAIDMMKEDIKKTFEEGYIGKVANSVDNKALFIAAVNTYFKELARLDVLDGSYENKAEVDIVAQRSYLSGQGVDTSLMSDEEVKKANTGSEVFVTAKVKFVDAMEDIQFAINM
ncbi:phage tail sheath C-terminal domain-containing protein [Vallitalea okinawensis]|uniref:phage tail sheath C-terminal domain-containing protein n=1 Tax=Vallitalea okinawensis TaxID=2078660 RepID=UPI000CFA9A8C|nr:phage tail sheath C-terminal domain-containing protein [Vallitalea okinawensis]